MNFDSLLDRLQNMQQVILSGEPQQPTFAEVDYDQLTLDNVETMLPVWDEKLYLYRVFGVYRRMCRYPGNTAVLQEAERDILQRIDKARQILGEYESKPVPAGAEEMHTAMISGFTLYYDGLMCFGQYFKDGDEINILDALDYVYQGDKFIFEVRNGIDRDRDEGRHAITL